MNRFTTLKVFIASISLLSFLVQSVPPASAKELLFMGPGNRIHGTDISRWQHPNGKAINFEKMRAAGVSFVMIKASDTRDESDQMALKYVKMDRDGAQAAGIHTGFYHYATLPNSESPSVIRKDAINQAQKVVWRIGSLGGFNEMDLPYALDLENNCVSWSSSGACRKYASRTAVTLFAKTFLKTVKTKTGRTPIFYSYPNFLERAMNRDKELSTYPLWLAQYSIDPAKPENKPNVKPGGCFVHSWTNSACSANWIVWQYTSCGIAPKYGVPGSRLDLNVFAGGQEKFNSLLTGSWIPESIDVMPRNETSTLVINSVTASTTNKNAVISVNVLRPDSSAVVTGTVRYYFTSINPTIPVVKQKIDRETSGQWTLTISGLPAGTWYGNVGFKDTTDTHSEVKVPLTLTIEQGPTPTPKPTKKPVVKPKTDGCKNQIKN
ncbi:Acm Lyzozyme M1 (1,4-beta-N-acetylmuramidase) [Candidatus Nanopelagicaceae bacterium]